MKIIVGLGNPGEAYRTTRHNVGYLILSELAARLATSPPKARFQADTLQVSVGGQSILLLCPSTYMNRSGQSVIQAVRFYKTPPEDVFVVCDDLDLPLAKIRIRSGGGTGGQKGLKDIVRVLGTVDFPRLRFGIGRPPDMCDPADYVLSRFTAAEKKSLPFEFQRAADAVVCYVTEGLDAAMNRYNNRAE